MRLLFVGTTWPESNATAAGLRAQAMLESFRKRSWKLAFVTPAHENEFTARLREQGDLAASIPPNDSRFDETLKSFKPDIVLFDRFPTEEQFSWRVAQVMTDALRVLDTVDLHYLRRAREEAAQAGMPIAETLALQPETEDRTRELAAIYRSDLALVCSSAELDRLRDLQVPEPHLHHLPLLYPEPPPAPDFDERKHFVMIGNFRHPPNADAIHWLKREIWPRIRQRLPDAEVHVYGAYPSKKMMDLTESSDGFFVRGPAEDQFTTLARYRANLAPLRFGAGLKGKIADGWFTGMPCVTTSIGAEGMQDGSRFGGLVADTAEAFADAAVELHEKMGPWSEKARIGTETLRARFLAQPNTDRLISALERTHHELPAVRVRNLVGQMLWHHAHRSTEYFSRWIELKNSR